MTTICIDDREPEHLIKFLIKKYPEIEFNVKRLITGDYRGANIIVERKTIGDLHKSILDGRFSSQFNRMCAIQDCHKMLLVTGSIDDYIKMLRYKKIRINRDMLLSTISSAAYRYGASIIWTDSDESGLTIIIPIMKTVIDGNYMSPEKAHPHILLARLLQIPKKTLIDLLKEFKTIEALCKASEDDLQKINGIGKVRAASIKRVLTGVI